MPEEEHKSKTVENENLNSKFLFGNISRLSSRWQSWLLRVQSGWKFTIYKINFFKSNSANVESLSSPLTQYPKLACVKTEKTLSRPFRSIGKMKNWTSTLTIKFNLPPKSANIFIYIYIGGGRGIILLVGCNNFHKIYIPVMVLCFKGLS